MKLQGFNNLTKTLSFNSYNMAYTPTAEHRAAWQEYIAGHYSCERLTQILSEVVVMIEANILNIARQTYEPQGTSVTMLVSEQTGRYEQSLSNCHEGEGESGPLPEHVVMHLDKSHLTVHTYPESDPVSDVSIVRVDIDVSTCGRISPLKVLNYLMQCFEPDMVLADYRVRGFIRNINGEKRFLDHEINSIQDFMAADVLRYYRAEDHNLSQEAIFHTRLMLKTLAVNKYLFGQQASVYDDEDLQSIKQMMFEEMAEIFRG